MRNVIVTGGAGYIGRHIVRKILQAGDRVFVIDDFSNSKKSSLRDLRVDVFGGGFEVVEMDVASRVWHDSIPSGLDISAVIHLAAFKYNSVAITQPLSYYSNNLDAMLSVLKFMEERRVVNLVFSSSAAVYGVPASSPVIEDIRLQPQTAYGSSKRICEEIIEHFVRTGCGFKAINLRYFNPLGACDDGTLSDDPRSNEFSVAQALRRAALDPETSFQVFGADYDTPDGSCVRDYIHVQDVADAHVHALDLLYGISHGHYFDTFNIGTGKGVSVLELIRLYTEGSGKRIRFDVRARREGDVACIFGNVSKAAAVLGWRPKRSLLSACASDWLSALRK
jgi:UDP-glucose 4-epimerase